MADPKKPEPDDAPTWSPPVEEPETEGLPDEKRDPNPDENRDPPVHAKTSGAADKSKDPLPDPFDKRKSDAPREAGVTPRPTDKPITGGDR